MVLFVRTSSAELHGGAQALAGAGAEGDLANGSLTRQLALLAAACGDLSTGARQLKCNGVSIASAAAAAHPLLAPLRRELGPVAVLATALDRVTRAVGTLQELRDAAKENGSEIVTLLQCQAVMTAALQPADCCATAMLGARVVEGMRASDGGEAALTALEDWMRSNYALQCSSPGASAVLAPVCIGSCSEAVFAALLREEKQAGAFASGRQASFTSSICTAAAAAKAAGVEAFKLAAPPSAGSTRGASARQKQAAVVGASAAIREMLGGQAGALDVSLAHQPNHERAWHCQTCSCSPRGPDPACRCRCIKCRLAHEASCSCPAACDQGGVCRCLVGCSCSCLHCHDSTGAAAGPPPAEKQCPICGAAISRTSQVYCTETCYVLGCALGGTEPLRCPQGDACVEVAGGGPPGLCMPGGVSGQQECLACFKARKNTRQNEQRRAMRQRQPAASPAVQAGHDRAVVEQDDSGDTADTTPPAAPSGHRKRKAGAEQDENVPAGAEAPAAESGRDKRRAPPKKGLPRLEWTGERELALAQHVADLVQRRRGDAAITGGNGVLAQVSWAGLLATPAFHGAATSQMLSGKLKRMRASVESGKLGRLNAEAAGILRPLLPFLPQ